jgi:hypothetical protein
MQLDNRLPATVTATGTMDSHGDGDGGQWLTYEEIAEARGIKRLAAVRLTQRHRWRRQRGNDGHARVLVPDDMLRRDRGDSDDDKAGDSYRDTPALLAAIETAHLGEVTALRGEAEALKGEIAALRTLADATGSRLVGTEARLAEAEARTDALSSQLAVAEAALDRALAEAHTAQDAASELRRADAARRARGRLARAWRAWRGE